MLFAIVLFIADVGSTDKIVEDGLQNRVVDEAVVVDIFIVDVSAATWLLQDTLKFPYKPPVNVHIQQFNFSFNQWSVLLCREERQSNLF